MYTQALNEFTSFRTDVCFARPLFMKSQDVYSLFEWTKVCVNDENQSVTLSFSFFYRERSVVERCSCLGEDERLQRSIFSRPRPLNIAGPQDVHWSYRELYYETSEELFIESILVIFFTCFQLIHYYYKTFHDERLLPGDSLLIGLHSVRLTPLQ